MSLPPPPDLAITPPTGWSALAARLRQIGLTPKFVKRIQESGMGLTVGRQHTLWLAEWRRERFPAALALRMLMLGDPISEDDAKLALTADLFPFLRDAGLIVSRERGWASPFTLSFLDDLFLFSDRTTLHPDGVLAVSATTQLLAQASTVAHEERLSHVLDLGCGCGALAIRHAQRANQVFATDVNPRAIAFSQFNAALNGVANITFRTGDLYSPAAGETFDLIVCQPPFVACAPHAEQVVSMHAGPEGDEIALRVVLEAGHHLQPSGRLVMLNDWPMRSGSEASILERLRSALAGYNVHLVVLLSDPIDISTHCASYAGPPAPGAEEHLANQITLSLDHFASKGIVSVRQGLITIERADAHREYQMLIPSARWTNCSRAGIDRIFTALRFQAEGIGNHLSSSVRVAPGTTFVCRWTGAPEDGNLFAEPPADVFFPMLPINPGALQLIKALDAAATLQEGIAQMAAAEKLPPETLYPHIESALATGLMRGILTLDSPS